MSGQLEVPNVDLDRDIGGYAKVKQRLRAEILARVDAVMLTPPDALRVGESGTVSATVVVNSTFPDLPPLARQL
jgi:hypothetical protein